MEEVKKHIIIILLATSILAAITLFAGCCSTCEPKQEKFVPHLYWNDELYLFPPAKQENLLHVSESYAYKSVTIKDYKDDEDNCLKN